MKQLADISTFTNLAGSQHTVVQNRFLGFGSRLGGHITDYVLYGKPRAANIVTTESQQLLKSLQDLKNRLPGLIKIVSGLPKYMSEGRYTRKRGGYNTQMLQQMNQTVASMEQALRNTTAMTRQLTTHVTKLLYAVRSY